MIFPIINYRNIIVPKTTWKTVTRLGVAPPIKTAAIAGNAIIRGALYS